MQPNKSSRIVEEDLKLRIKNNEFAYNQKLPSERVIAEQYNVQRATVREALKNLENEGIIYTVLRQGAFLSEPRIVRTNTKIESVAKSIDRSNLDVSIELNSFEYTYMDNKLATKMKMEIGMPIISYQRHIYSNSNPLAIETLTVLRDKCPTLLEEDSMTLDTFETIQNKFNISAETSDKTLKVVYSNKKEIGFFNLDQARYLLKEEGLVFDKNQTTFAFIEYILLPEKFIHTN